MLCTLSILDCLCLRIHWNLYAIPAFIPLFGVGQSSGVILQTVFLSFDFKRRQLESLLGSRPRDSCRGLLKKSSLSAYSVFSCLLWTIRIFSMSIQKYTVSVLGKILTFISLRLTYHCIRKGLTMLVFKFLIVSPSS